MEPAVCGMVAYRGPSRMARWTCRFSYTTMRHVGGTGARFGRLSRDVSASGRLMVIFLFLHRSRLCVCDVRPWKAIVELKRAELAAATVPPAVAPTAKGAYGRPDPRVEADSIDFGFSAGSKETDLLGKAAESAHRQPQADVAALVFLLGEGAWSVSPSPWPVLRQEFSIPENARRPCMVRPWLAFVEIRYDSFGLRASSRVRPTRKER